MFSWNNLLTTDADYTNRAARYFLYCVRKQRAVALKKKNQNSGCFFGIISLEKKRPKSSLWFVTWEEYKDFGCFVVLPPAVCIFTVQRVTGVLAGVGTGAVDHPQEAKPLLLDCPAWTTEATGLRTSNLHTFKQRHSLEVMKVSVSELIYWTLPVNKDSWIYPPINPVSICKLQKNIHLCTFINISVSCLTAIINISGSVYSHMWSFNKSYAYNNCCNVCIWPGGALWGSCDDR